MTSHQRHVRGYSQDEAAGRKRYRDPVQPAYRYERGQYRPGQGRDRGFLHQGNEDDPSPEADRLQRGNLTDPWRKRGIERVERQAMLQQEVAGPSRHGRIIGIAIHRLEGGIVIAPDRQQMLFLGHRKAKDLHR